MKASELRIGNWYWFVKFGVPVTCELTDLSELCLRSDDAYNDPPINEMFEPIALTEEWLLKFGFEQPYDDSLTIFTKDIKESPFEEGFRIEEREETGCYMIDDYYIKIKYVHQLQNLYFALTGEELIIKE